MGVFADNVVTDAGLILLSYVQMGAIFTPTRIVIGSGYLPGGTTTTSITDVVAPVQTLTITKKKRSNDGKVTIGGVYSNQLVNQDFYFRELALYAKAVDTEGAEVMGETLYSYGNAGDTADLMPAISSGQPVQRQIDIVTTISNNLQVDLTLEDGVFMTQDQAKEFLKDQLDQGVDADKIIVNVPGVSETTLEQIIIKLSPILQIEGDNIQTVLSLTHVKSGGENQLTGLGGAEGEIPVQFKLTADIFRGEALKVDGTAYNLKSLYGTTVSGSGAAEGAEKLLAAGALVVGAVNTADKSLTVQQGFSESLYFTFPASGWTGSAAPYTQTIQAAGVALNLPKPVIGRRITASGTEEAISQKDAFSMIDDVERGNGTLTATCYEDKPEIDIPIICQIIR